MDILKKYGAEVSYYDPYVPVIQPSREHGHWAGTKSIDWEAEEVGSHDLTLVLTNHSEIDYSELLNWAQLIVDTRDVMRRSGANGSDKVWRS
jgi:UDP-N-acetyl-D-glucosamine dehydrogenase